MDLTQTHPAKQAAKQYLLSTCIIRDYLQLKVTKQKSYILSAHMDYTSYTVLLIYIYCMKPEFYTFSTKYW